MIPPGVLFEPDFLPEHARLFGALVQGVAWNESMRARRTACFGEPYNYSGMKYDATPMHPLLVPIVDRLEGKIGFRPNNCLLNHYEDGRSTMGFHSDSEEELSDGTGVAIVSLGAPRAITFRGKQDKGTEHTLALPGGSLLHMPRGLQQAWKHAILAQPLAEGRISLTFRSLRSASLGEGVAWRGRGV